MKFNVQAEVGFKKLIGSSGNNKVTDPAMLNQMSNVSLHLKKSFQIRGKSLLDLLVTTFLPDCQPPLIFVSLTSKSHEH